jgi:hypothetical protein
MLLFALFLIASASVCAYLFVTKFLLPGLKDDIEYSFEDFDSEEDSI